MVNEQSAEAQALGVTGTPSFFINGRASFGNLTVEQLRQVIDEEMAQVQRKPNQRAAANQ
jgi:protein-disulfide isomerase